MMTRPVLGCAGLLLFALSCGQAAAWSHASAWEASAAYTEASGSASISHPDGSATHASGAAMTGVSRDGDSTVRVFATGSTPMIAYGSAAYIGPYFGAYYPAYHPITSVNYYGYGCYNCGGWSTAGAAAAGAMAGLTVGATMFSASTAAIVSSAHSAAVAASTPHAMGAIHAKLPAGCNPRSVQGKTYYLCGETWFKPAFGANGVYYRVVPTP